MKWDPRMAPRKKSNKEVEEDMRRIEREDREYIERLKNVPTSAEELRKLGIKVLEEK